MAEESAQDAAGASVNRGRPREVENGVRVSVRLPAPDYDRLDRLARASGISVPTAIRGAISALINRR
jgi:hypothetical protein